MVIIYQAIRKLHLWVGLILSLVLLIEAITGLILAEPWLLGQENSRPPTANLPADSEQKRSMEMRSTTPSHSPTVERSSPTGIFTLLGLAKGLHQGRIGAWSAKWLVDLAAIGMIILTVTGIYIAIPHLRANSRAKPRP